MSKFWRNRCCLLLILVVFGILSNEVESAHGVDDDIETKTNDPKARKGKQVISLAESIRKYQIQSRKERAETMQGYWKNTFLEIKNLAVFPGRDNSQKNPFDGWRRQLARDEAEEKRETSIQPFTGRQSASSAVEEEVQGSKATKRTRHKARFEGFASWDRLLQEWADDVAEYLEKNQAEGGEEYRFSNYGRPARTSSHDTVHEVSITDVEHVSHEESETSEEVAIDIMVSLNGTVQFVPQRTELPTPATAATAEPVLPHTDISDKSKRIWIVTTAALPWMTGTAVNPLLRAAYLTKGRKAAGGRVTLMLPWLSRQDQERVYGKDRVFDNQEDQENFIRTWLRDSAKMEAASEELHIAWYIGRQERAENSVYSMGDITAGIPEDEVDICILEEPEHLNWYRYPGESSWTQKFPHVVGIIHTNYFVYAQEQPGALIRAPAMKLLCSWMCRAHCHRVIKLSGTLGRFAPEKELVENVHGVRGTFLDIGNDVRKRLTSSKSAMAKDPVFGSEADPSIYFIGKMLWSKGLGSLMELLKYAEESADLKLKVDMYGGGPDKDAAEAKSLALGLEMPYHGPVDHSKLATSHKIFINPSTSEVLCTTVSEALAMGKFVILPSHPSNDFFAQFPNCLPYASKEEFVGNLYYALTHAPEPLTKEYAYALSWDAATDRLERAGCISVREAEATAKAMEDADAGVQINLPPLIENESQRKRIATSLRLSRERYRLFRSRLAEDIRQNKVLPKEVQRKLVMELEKRLDINFDAILESPKLSLQLSPAELDKRLLELYKTVGNGPYGDLIRVIGGGTYVGRQNLYMKQQARKQARRERKLNYMLDPISSLPVFFEDDDDDVEEGSRTAAQWVKYVLRQNLPNRNNPNLVTSFTKKNGWRSSRNSGDEMKMQYGCSTDRTEAEPRSIPISSRSIFTSSILRPKHKSKLNL